MPVHEARVDGLVPGDVLAAQSVRPVACGQVEEFCAGQQSAVAAVRVCVDDRAPDVLRGAVRVPAAQEDRGLTVFAVADADHAAQVRVVVAFRTSRIRRLIVGGAGWVEQRDLRVDERGFARFARAGEQGHRHRIVHGRAEHVVAAVGAPVDDLPALQHPTVGNDFHAVFHQCSPPSKASSAESKSNASCSTPDETVPVESEVSPPSAPMDESS